MIVQSPADPGLYATLTELPDGVRVGFWRASSEGKRDHARFLGGATVVAPYHLIRDKVHDLLRDLT